METECIWDTSEHIVGQISALKLLGFTGRDAATQITEWGFTISQSTIGSQWNRYKRQNLGNHMENSGRKHIIGEDIKQLMIERVKFDCWVIAAALS
jgi:hypothetical protein